MWNGAAEALKAKPARIIAKPASSITSPESPWSAVAAAIPPSESAPVAP